MMFKRMAFGGLFALLILVALGYSFRTRLFTFFLVPDIPYVKPPKSEQLDYSLDASWLALPHTKDSADVLAKGETDRQAEAVVDVFFIHPTTLISGAVWNDPLDGRSDRIIQRDRTINLNASAYNGCCRIFAPQYRQATLGSYAADDPDLLAVNGAFQDILAAFDVYMERFNQGRPIIIASHSQGSDHGMLLLKHRFSGMPLLEKLVAAYLPGRPFAKDSLQSELPDIPLCQSKLELGCFVSWMTFGPDAVLDKLLDHTAFLRDGKIVSESAKAITCVNPLSWTTGSDWHTQSQGHGLYLYDDENGAVIFKEKTVVARCRPEDGALEIKPPFWGLLTGRTNYHIHDVPLFYKEVRQNAKQRVARYLELHSSSEKPGDQL